MKKPIDEVRIVSLVPSLTETLWDLNVGAQVVGVTKFCVRPPEAMEAAVVVGGTKDVDVDTVKSLEPDLVLADEDENKPEHLEDLEGSGIRVHTTRVASVADAGREVVAIGRILGRGVEAEGWRQRIQERAAEVRDAAALAGRLRGFVPIWRKPLMTAGAATYLSDLVRVCGVDNVFGGTDAKYFETSFGDVGARDPDAVLLPTEPYRFRDGHRAAFADGCRVPLDAVQVVDGQAMTWFGTHTLRGLDVVAESVARLRARLEKA